MNNTLTIALLNDQYLRAKRAAFKAHLEYKQLSHLADRFHNRQDYENAVKARDFAIQALDEYIECERAADRYSLKVISEETELEVEAIPTEILDDEGIYHIETKQIDIPVWEDETSKIF